MWENERLLAFTPRDVVDARSRRRLMAPDDDFNHVFIGRGVKQILMRAVPCSLARTGSSRAWARTGSCGCCRRGDDNLEAIRCATLNGAKYLGLDGELGSLEKGKLADLIVLDRNPLENIRNTESVGMVMVNGRLYESRDAERDRQSPQAAPGALVRQPVRFM